jgi:hypothetical protein
MGLPFMANTSVVRGFVPARGVNSQSVTGGPRLYSHAAGDGVAIMVGDPVKIAGTAQTINGVTTQDVVRAATGDVICGVCVGILPATRDTAIYGVASTAYQLFVDDDPNTLFEIQDLNSGTALTVADVGLNVDFVVAAGNTTLGTSGVTLNNATEATTNTLDVKIVDVVNRADQDNTSSPLKFLVRFNRHLFSNQVAGV